MYLDIIMLYLSQRKIEMQQTVSAIFLKTEEFIYGIKRSY